MIKTIAHLVVLNLKTQMAFRFQFWMLLVIKALGYLSGYLMIWLLLARFRGIGGWSIPEVMTLWSLSELSYTLAAPFFYHSIGKLDDHIVKGTYESLVVQPIHPLLNLIARHFSWTYSSQIILNAVVLGIALSRSAFTGTPMRVGYLCLTIVGGMGFQAFTFLIGGAMSFRWIKAGRQLSKTMRWFGTNLTQYPISIYPGVLRWLLTYIIPAALMNYYPAMYLVDRVPEGFPIGLLWIAPIVLVCLGMSGFALFRRSERSYQGSGG